ncbi:MAG: hypothetical protein HYT46_00795, partial [Candidatus Vogelbacteria bacterium]|nr:hypothetical protein [Candidatus Vogelbacteria bacterium]
MKKHLLLVLALAVVFLVSPLGGPFVTRAQTNTALVTQLKAQLAKLQATLLTLTQSGVTVSSLNNQIATKIGRVSPAELKSLLDQRKALMLDLAKVNPRQFLSLVIKESDRNRLPAELKNKVESPIQIEGKIEVWHIDDFENPENSRYDYYLRQGQTKFFLYPTKSLMFPSETTLQINGYQLESSIVADTDTSGNMVVTAGAPPPRAIGDQKTLLLLVNFLDSAITSFTPEQAESMIFKGQFQDFYREQSYGKISFSGDTKGWYTIPKNAAASSFCNRQPVGAELADLLIANGVSLENYDRLVILFSGPSCYANSWSSIGKVLIYVGNRTYYISQAMLNLSAYLINNVDFPLYISAHEMGHSLGLVHANGWDCGDQVNCGNGVSLEYGNSFDTMGRGNGPSRHFNALTKYFLGWLEPESVLTITQSGRYTLNPLELDSGVKLTRVLLPDGSIPYYFEYRRAYGYDSGLGLANRYGLMANIDISNRPDYPSSDLLDFIQTPGVPFRDDLMNGAVLKVNQAYVDPITGIRIGPVIGADDNAIVFDINIPVAPPCLRYPPLITELTRPVYTISGSASGTALFKITNNDSLTCGSSQFIARQLPRTDYFTNVVYNPSSFNLSPGKSEVTTESFTTPSGVSQATTIHNQNGIEIINQETGSITDRVAPVYVLGPSIITSIDPNSNITTPGATIVINGSRLRDTHFFSRVEFLESQRNAIIAEVVFPPPPTWGIYYPVRLQVPPSLLSGKYGVRVCRMDVCSNSKSITIEIKIPIVEPIVPITSTSSPLVPIPIPPPPPTTVAIISSVTTTAAPTLTASVPPHNAVMAQDSSSLVGWKLAALTFSSDLGPDWNNPANYSIESS